MSPTLIASSIDAGTPELKNQLSKKSHSQNPSKLSIKHPTTEDVSRNGSNLVAPAMAKAHHSSMAKVAPEPKVTNHSQMANTMTDM